MRLEETIAALKAVPLFWRVEPEALRLLAFSAIKRQLRAGDMLFRRGEQSDGGFLVLSGEVVLDAADDGARSSHVYGPGTLIGRLALFAVVQRPATAIARDGAAVLVLSRDLMLRVLEANPSSAMALRDALAQETRELAGGLERLGL